IFTQMLFVDEITRMSPKTQSALLQAMSEGFVTVNGKRYELPHPFMVIATCNPRDTEGSNPLPQAQLDRFRSRPVVGNISFHDEMEIARNDVNRPGKTKDLRQKISVLESQGKAVTRENMRTAFGQQASAKALQPVLGPNDVAFYQSLSRDLPISENLLKDITTFIRKLRPQEESADPSIAGEKILNSGTDGQRTGESIRSMVRGLALVRGDFAPGKEHLKTVAYPIAGHRLSLRSARDIYKTEKNIVQAVLDSTLD
ncbi:MAG TPA: AAA family ATPase, partial [Alphaproteobacteria bacterium]|nr:AAA family ATPase [Alphaproteobacteria bacterium]